MINIGHLAPRGGLDRPTRRDADQGSGGREEVREGGAGADPTDEPRGGRSGGQGRP